MRNILLVGVAALLAACGVETAGTAATAAAAKKQEIEQGRKTMEQAGARAAGAMDQAQDRLRDADK
jgi:F0F1-type ATP synthase membrane subunit c/vacuolar-type H+-ATPase subunit K